LKNHLTENLGKSGQFQTLFSFQKIHYQNKISKTFFQHFLTKRGKNLKNDKIELSEILPSKIQDLRSARIQSQISE